MSKVTHEEKAVAARLRHEIAASRPSFSEGLHNRLCRAIQQQRADAVPSLGHRFVRWMPVVAAVCLLIAVGIGWQAIGVGSRGIAKMPKTSIGSVTGLAIQAIQVVAKADAMMDGAAKAQRWAYLDHDARMVSEMPVARLPFDVVSSLLSVKRQKDSRVPLSGCPETPLSLWERGRG